MCQINYQMMFIIQQEVDSDETSRLDFRVLLQLLSAWLLWLLQLLGSVRYVTAYLTSKRRLPYVIDEYGDVTYRPPKREWLRQLFMTEAAIHRRLLDWVRREIPGNRVLDMTSSWADGIALCALVEKLKPGACPRHDLLKPLQKMQNCKLALKLVIKHFNIPPSVITPEEMAYCRDAKKMKQLLSLVRYYHRYPISAELTSPRGGRESCWARGEGLRHGEVGRKAQFVVQTPADEEVNLAIDIQGPNGEEGREEITTALPIRKTCKFFDDDAEIKDEPRYEHSKMIVDYQCVGEGRYLIHFTPPSSGNYSVALRWHQDDIPGSPFTVRVDDPNASLREGNLLNPGGKEGEWNYEQYGSTVVRRRSIVIDSGRRLSALAMEQEEKRKSMDEERKTPELVKQRTVTRRRVIKRVMTLGGREVTMETEQDPEEMPERKASLPKLGLFETVAMAIRERRSPSPGIDQMANDLGQQVIEEAYKDFRSGSRTPLLKDSARENPSIFQKVRTESQETHENGAEAETQARSRNTSGGDSGIDLTNGKKISPNLETLAGSNDSQSDDMAFYPILSSTPKTQSEDTTDSMEFATPVNSKLESEPKRYVYNQFKVVQSPSMKKTVLYMTGENVKGTMSLETLQMESESTTLPVEDGVSRGKLQLSKSLNFDGESEKVRPRSNSLTKRRSPKRPSSPFSPKRGFDRMVDDFHKKQQRPTQRASLTRQSDHVQSVTVETRDFSVQTSSDVIKREMNRQSSLRRRRKKRYINDVTESETRTVSTTSDYLRPPSMFSSNDDVITVSTDDVTLPSMTSSLRESTPNFYREFKFQNNETKTEEKYVSGKSKPRSTPSKVTKTRKRTFRERLELRVSKWLKNMAISDFMSIEVRPVSQASSQRTEAKTPSDFTLPCDCRKHLTNKKDYVDQFGQLFESELCRNCVDEFKTNMKDATDDDLPKASDKNNDSEKPFLLDKMLFLEARNEPVNAVPQLTQFLKPDPVNKVDEIGRKSIDCGQGYENPGVRSQELRDYEYKPSPIPVHKPTSAQVWSPEQWHDLTETSYLQLPTKRPEMAHVGETESQKGVVDGGIEKFSGQDFLTSGTSTLDSRNTGLSCQTCPSDTTSSLTQGQGQGQGQCRGHGQRLGSDHSDVIQQTTALNDIFSSLNLLQTTASDLEQPRAKSFLQGEIDREIEIGRRFKSPSPDRCLSRSSSQASVGRQFLNELDALIRRHAELRELGYGESPRPAMCEASGTGLNYATVGVKNNFQVRTNHAGNGTLSVSIHGPTPHCVTETTVLYTGDCLYEVFYQVTRPGYYIITIKWSDVNIPNSPFICKVE